MPEVVEGALDDTKQMLISIENELARLALTSQSEEAHKAVKVCVYHIILRAITLTKDPKTDISESKRLFQLAQEIIAEAGLGDESDLKDRLTDLINAMVDQDDLAIQFRFYRLQNSEYFKSVFEMIRNEAALKTEEYENLHEMMQQNRIILNKLSKKKNVFRVFLVSFMALAVLLFTIISSVVIILALLSANSSNPSSSYEKSLMQQMPAYERPSVEKIRE